MLWPWRLTPTARPAERYWVTCAWMLWMGVAYFKTRAPGCACVHLNFWDCCCRGLWVASVVCSCWCHFCWLVFAPFRLCVVLRFHCFPAVSLLCRFSFCAVPFVVSVPRFLVHVLRCWQFLCPPRPRVVVGFVRWVRSMGSFDVPWGLYSPIYSSFVLLVMSIIIALVKILHEWAP